MPLPTLPVLAAWATRGVQLTAATAKDLWKSAPGLSQLASKVWTGVGGASKATFGKLGPLLKDKSLVLSAIYIAATELGQSLTTADAEKAASIVVSSSDPESALLDLIHSLLVSTDLSPLDGEDSDGHKLANFTKDLAMHKANADALRAAQRILGLNTEDLLRVRQVFLMDSDELQVAVQLL